MTSRVALDVLESVYAPSANEDAWHASVAETVLRSVRAEYGSGFATGPFFFPHPPRRARALS